MDEFRAFSQEEILREYSNPSQESLRFIINESTLPFAQRVGYVFLSHSNKDKALARAFAEMMNDKARCGCVHRFVRFNTFTSAV